MTEGANDVTVCHAVIAVEGDLTVDNAAELKKKMREAIETSGSVVVRCDDSARVDISFLQLACAAYRTSLCSGKGLKLSLVIPDSLMRVVRSAGFSYHPVWQTGGIGEKRICNGGGDE